MTTQEADVNYDGVFWLESWSERQTESIRAFFGDRFPIVHHYWGGGANIEIRAQTPPPDDNDKRPERPER